MDVSRPALAPKLHENWTKKVPGVRFIVWEAAHQEVLGRLTPEWGFVEGNTSPEPRWARRIVDSEVASGTAPALRDDPQRFLAQAHRESIMSSSCQGCAGHLRPALGSQAE